MRKLIALLCLLLALALGPPGQADTVSPLINAPPLVSDTPDNLFDCQINTAIQPITVSKTIIPTVLKPISNTTDQTAYEKPGLSMAELLYFCGEQYLTYCLTNESNVNGDNLLEGTPLKRPIANLNNDSSADLDHLKILI